MNLPRCGYDLRSGLYFETLGETSGAPLLFIHGGGATGACWRVTPDGRLGWADELAARGHRCLVTDWPGTGRSGGQEALNVGYSEIVDAYRGFLRLTVGEPVTVVCHSMGGAVAWQLLSLDPDLVDGVVSVAGAYPGNLGQPSQIRSDAGGVVEVAFSDTGVHFRVDRNRLYHYEDAYIRDQAIAGSTRFAREHEAAMRAGLVGIPPRVLLQRMGVEPGMPTVERPSGFRGKKVRLLAGPEDPAHTRAIEERTVAQLLAWGAEATLTWLPDIGIAGNGHFPFYETNSLEILTVVETLLKEIHR